MRLLSILLTLVLLVGFLGFVVTNLDARVDVTVWKTPYGGVSLHLVVILSLLAGALWVGIIGIGQGVQMWLVNRRLTRDMQKLETELNYLRTQPVTRPAPDAVDDSGASASRSFADDSDADGASMPRAPVYGPENDGDPDDDVYSGGRAV